MLMLNSPQGYGLYHRRREAFSQKKMYLSLESMEVETSSEALVTGKVSKIPVGEVDVVKTSDMLYISNPSEISNDQRLSIAKTWQL